MTLRNTTDTTLWCALLDLTETYGVFTDAFPAGTVELGPGQQTTVSLSGQVSDEQWQAGMIQPIDRLRIVISTVEFDPRYLEQAELDAAVTVPGDASRRRDSRSSLAAVLTRAVPGATRNAERAPLADWRVEELLVVTTRPRHWPRTGQGRRHTA